jgi:hypothetical protein
MNVMIVYSNFGKWEYWLVFVAMECDWAAYAEPPTAGGPPVTWAFGIAVDGFCPARGGCSEGQISDIVIRCNALLLSPILVWPSSLPKGGSISREATWLAVYESHLRIACCQTFSTCRIHVCMTPHCPRISFTATCEAGNLRDGTRPRSTIFYWGVNPMSGFDATRAVVEPV